MRVMGATSILPRGDQGDLRCPDPGVLEEALGMTRPRRVGRLGRLAAATALAAARDAGRSPPLKDLAILLGCGLGNEGETRPVVERTVAIAMGLVEGPASPVHFANSVSNSATFLAAQVLGAHGPNAVISADDHSFEAALWAASWILRAGDAPAVLCGGLDEWTEPREGPLARMGLPPAARLGEGGGWLWLEAEPGDSDGPLAPGTIRSPLRIPNARAPEVLASLCQDPGLDEGLVLLAGRGITPGDLTPLSGRIVTLDVYRDRIGHFPTASAAAIAQVFGDPEAPLLTHLHLARSSLGILATLFRPGGLRCG